MRKLALSLFLLLPALPASAEPPPVNGLAWVGDLELRFDANRWAINGADAAYVIHCRIHDCRRTEIFVSISDATDADCTPKGLIFDQGGSYSDWPFDLENEGLQFHVSEADIGCRNLAGGPVRACTTFGGRTYNFDAPGQHCRTPYGAGHRVEEILRGLRPR